MKPPGKPGPSIFRQKQPKRTALHPHAHTHTHKATARDASPVKNMDWQNLHRPHPSRWMHLAGTSGSGNPHLRRRNCLPHGQLSRNQTLVHLVNPKPRNEFLQGGRIRSWPLRPRPGTSVEPSGPAKRRLKRSSQLSRKRPALHEVCHLWGDQKLKQLCMSFGHAAGLIKSSSTD